MLSLGTLILVKSFQDGEILQHANAAQTVPRILAGRYGLRGVLLIYVI